MLTRIQFLIMSLIVTAPSAAYIVILQLLLDANIPLRWSVFFWFFGGLAVFAILHFGYLLVRKIGKKRHATLNKDTNETYQSLIGWIFSPDEPHPLAGDEKCRVNHDRVNEGLPPL